MFGFSDEGCSPIFSTKEENEAVAALVAKHEADCTENAPSPVILPTDGDL